MSKLVNAAMEMVYRCRHEAIYAWDVAKLGPGEPDPEYRELVPGPGFEEEASRLLPPSWWRGGRQIMIHRLRAGRARLFVVEIDGRGAGYGYTQRWDVFSWAGRWLQPPGVIIGPYRTDPDFRRRGLYSRFIKHVVHAEVQSGATYFYGCVETWNEATRKRLERLGVDPLGVYDQLTWFKGIHHSLRLLPHLPARVSELPES